MAGDGAGLGGGHPGGGYVAGCAGEGGLSPPDEREWRSFSANMGIIAGAWPVLPEEQEYFAFAKARLSADPASWDAYRVALLLHIYREGNFTVAETLAVVNGAREFLLPGRGEDYRLLLERRGSPRATPLGVLVRLVARLGRRSF